MKFFKLSHGDAFFNDNTIQVLKNANLVSVHPNTKAKGQNTKGQGEEFVDAKKGDLFYVCRSNNSIEFIGMFSDEQPLFSAIPEHDEWVDREYILIANAVNPSAYNKSFDKWWSPRNNSTFAEVPKSDNSLFETEILKPVFNTTFEAIKNSRNEELEKLTLSMLDYIEMQREFKKLMNNEELFFEKVNGLTNRELKKIEYAYLKRGDISGQPVVLLRSKLLEILLKGDKLNANIISQVKQDLDALFDTNAYHAWSSNYRILYTFLYDKYKSELEAFFKQLITKLQNDLGIENDTKIKLVHLDGPQNQGYDRIWFAIYNKINKSQKLAKQLFFEIYDGLNYGLLNHADKTKNELKHSKHFDYEDVLNAFKLFKQNILKDNSMERAKLAEYIDILKHKKQIILQGPPGTGKTYTAKKIAEQVAGVRRVDSYNSLTPEKIKSALKVGQKIANASGKEDFYTINEINENEIVLQSEKSQPWKANYSRTIEKFIQLTEGIEPKNTNNLDPYELAVAKYMFNIIKPTKTKTTSNFTIVQFHPSYTYEDFVRGITVNNENGSIVYKTENKIIAQLSEIASKKNNLEDYNIPLEYRNFLHQKGIEASKNNTHYYFNKEKTIRLKDVPTSDTEIGNLRYETLINVNKWQMQTWVNIEDNYNLEKWLDPFSHRLSSYNKPERFAIWQDFDVFMEKLQNNDYILIIDEINRANLPSVLGELIYALEYRGETVNSMYAINGNNQITIPENLYIIGTMNTADRSVGHIDYAIKRRFAFVDILPNAEVITNEKAKVLFNKVSDLFTEKYLASDFESKDVHLGHSYFILDENSRLSESEQLQLKLDYEIMPILNEYVKDGLLLETAKEKLKEIAKFEC